MNSEALLTLGPVNVYPFGLILGSAYLAAVFYFWRLGKRQGFSSESLLDAVFLSSLFGLLGGRVSFLLFQGTGFGPADLLRIGEGFFWAGGLFLGLAAFAGFSWVKRWSFFVLADSAALALALGQALGYFGAEYADYLPFAFYPSMGYLFLFALLRFLRGRIDPGLIFSAYLFFSGNFVWFTEWLRPDKAVWQGVNLNYLSGIVLGIAGAVGIAGLLISRRVGERRAGGKQESLLRGRNPLR